MNDEDFPPFQWICHFECLHYMKKVYIKEFCGYCIQTGETMIFYVKTPSLALYLLDPLHVATFGIQSQRHGFHIGDGEISIGEFEALMLKKIAKDCTIYTTCLIVEKYFNNLWYPDVINLTRFITNSIPKLPHEACSKKHSELHCARRKVLEIAQYLKPAFVPYLVCSIIREPCTGACTDSEQVRYGQHYLRAPHYQTLTTVDLLHHANKENKVEAVSNIEDCEYSLEG